MPVVAVVLRMDVPDTFHGGHLDLSQTVIIDAFRTLSLEADSVVRSLGIARSEAQGRHSNRVTTIFPRKIGE